MLTTMTKYTPLSLTSLRDILAYPSPCYFQMHHVLANSIGLYSPLLFEVDGCLPRTANVAYWP